MVAGIFKWMIRISLNACVRNTHTAILFRNNPTDQTAFQQHRKFPNKPFYSPSCYRLLV